MLSKGRPSRKTKRKSSTSMMKTPVPQKKRAKAVTERKGSRTRKMGQFKAPRFIDPTKGIFIEISVNGNGLNLMNN